MILASALASVHHVWAWVVVGANAGAGVWAVAAHWVPALRRRLLWWFTAAAEVSIGVQVVLGVALVAGEGIEVSQFHAFYGFVALATVGILHAYRAQLAAYRYLLFGLGGLFLMGLALRAVFLDPVP